MIRIAFIACMGAVAGGVAAVTAVATPTLRYTLRRYMLSAAATCCIFVPVVVFRDRPVLTTSQAIALDIAVAIVGGVAIAVIPTMVVTIAVDRYQARLKTTGVRLVAGGIIGAVTVLAVLAYESIAKRIPF
jgi:hypothetical protein